MTRGAIIPEDFRAFDGFLELRSSSCNLHMCPQEYRRENNQKGY